MSEKTVALGVSQEVPTTAATNTHFAPYYIQKYSLPEQVLKLYPEPDVNFSTPAFKQGKVEFTTQEEMMDFLQDLNDRSNVMKLEIIGYSLEGRELPFVIFTKSENEEDFQQKPTVWLQAQIHGNEPAAGESALVIAERLAVGDLGKELLQDINVVMAPRVSPDSAYYFERNTPTLVNGNRDYINLELPELRALYREFNKYQPEVVIDAHEYGARPAFWDVGDEGGLKYHDITLLGGKNLNIPESIRRKTDEWFIEPAFKNLDKDGFSYGPYFTVNAPKGETPVLTEGGVDIGTGRNAYALKPSFCILVESLGIDIGRENFLRRVAGQVVTHETILKATAEKGKEIKTTIQAATDEMINKGKVNGNIVIKSEPQEVPNKNMKVIDIGKGEIIEIPVKYFSSTEAVPVLERKMPKAYILPPSFHNIAAKLEMQGAQMKKLKEGQELVVESFVVTSKEFYNEDFYPTQKVTTTIEEKKIFFQKGSYVIPTDQRVNNLIALALEPESQNSFVSTNYIPIKKDRDVPIYRYINEEELEVE